MYKRFNEAAALNRGNPEEAEEQIATAGALQ